MPFRVGGFVSEEQAVAAPVQIVGLLLKANSASLSSDKPPMEVSLGSNFTEEKSLCCNDPPGRLSMVTDSLWGKNIGEEPNSVEWSKENHGCAFLVIALGRKVGRKTTFHALSLWVVKMAVPTVTFL
ncbi:hypothetical protein Ancab_027519 [Ancistrocladus abbreviatus]